MHTPRLTVAGVGVTTTLLLSAALASPASAAAGAGSGSVLGPNGRSLTVTVTLQHAETTTYACAALSTGDVVATSLDGCELIVDGVQVANRPAALPGPLAVSGGVQTATPPGAHVTVCARGRATYLDGSTLTANHCVSPVSTGTVPAPPPVGPVPGAGTTVGDGSTSVTVLGEHGVVCVEYYVMLPSHACVLDS